LGFYDQFIDFDDSKTSGNQIYGICPMHNDTNASFTVNVETDAWFCHGCGKGGHHVEFITEFYDVPRGIAVNACHRYHKTGAWMFPSEEYIEKCMAALQRRPAALDELHGFGITDEIIEKYQLGWDDIRVTIPIRSRTGMLVNVRKYLPPSKRIVESNNAKVIGMKGLNECRLYPYSVLLDADPSEPIYIVEGEKDCLVALSCGLNAMTGTGGTTLPFAELDLFAGRKVVIMTDNDAAGDKNAQRYITGLRPYTKDITRVRLPEKDFTDFWIKYHSLDFEPWTESAMAGPDAANTAVVGTTTLTKSEFVENLNSWIQLNNMCITGADPKTYTIPTKLKLLCKNSKCEKRCNIGSTRVPIELDVEPRQMVLFVESPDTTQDTYLQKLFGCKSIIAEPVAFTNVQKILFQESASFMDGVEEASFDHRYGLFLYDEGRLLPTVKYDFEACRVSDPRSQQNYYVIRKAATPQASVAGLSIPKETILFFQAIANKHAGEDIWAVLEEHYNLWRARLGIEGRLDLFGALLLTYLSVTEIKWRSGIIKGWLDTMVIGDTRTGKSQMAQRFVRTLGMGSYINGENAKRTGVIGGVQRFGDSWVITWGAIPLNDKGLLLVDEASGLSVDDIKELSATRSSGAVTINKIAKGEARARTRIIWLSNPRSGRNIDEFYWKGYGAFQEFIPIAEDQARYDVLIAAARDDVDVNSFQDVEEPVNMDDIISKMMDLVAYAWSVPVDDIILERDAVEAVKQAARELEEEFGGGPLVVGVAVHEKILRISCACAILKGRIVERCVEVTDKEVNDAITFLRTTFGKPTLDYAGFIKESKRVQRERVQNVTFIKAQISMYPALRVLLSSNQFRGGQMQEILGIDKTEASKLLSELLRRGLVRLGNSGAYSPDKMLIEITKQIGGE
jgi:hypothetical protein